MSLQFVPHEVTITCIVVVLVQPFCVRAAVYVPALVVIMLLLISASLPLAVKPFGPVHVTVLTLGFTLNHNELPVQIDTEQLLKVDHVPLTFASQTKAVGAVTLTLTQLLSPL